MVHAIWGSDPAVAKQSIINLNDKCVYVMCGPFDKKTESFHVWVPFKHEEPVYIPLETNPVLRVGHITTDEHPEMKFSMFVNWQYFFSFSWEVLAKF